MQGLDDMDNRNAKNIPAFVRNKGLSGRTLTQLVQALLHIVGGG